MCHHTNIIIQQCKIIIGLQIKNYLNPTAACHTNANNKKKTGITGSTSTIGLKITYASGKRDNNKVSISKYLCKYKVSNIKNVRFDNINFTIKLSKFLIYINVLFQDFFVYNYYY